MVPTDIEMGEGSEVFDRCWKGSELVPTEIKMEKESEMRRGEESGWDSKERRIAVRQIQLVGGLFQLQ